MFPLFATGVVYTGGKFAAGVIDTWQFATASLTPVANLSPVSLTPVANLPRASTTLAKLVKKFATGVVDTGWCTLTSEYLCEFLKKFKMVLMEYSGAGGKLIHEKNGSKKSRDTVPLSQ